MKVFEKNGAIFKLLSEAVAEGIIIVDTSQTIVATNTSANTMFGYQQEELRGSALNLLLPAAYHEDHSRYVSQFMSHSNKRPMGRGRELFGRRKDGSEFPVEAGLNPFEIYGKKYVMALVIDITIRKAQQEEILALNAHLEDKIAERTQLLNNTVEELKQEVALRKKTENRLNESLKKEIELSDLKTKFLSLVSHEFKTPLTGMLSSVSLATIYLEKQQVEKIQKHLDTIRSKIKYLTNILNDFLSVEQLSSGKVSYTITAFPLNKTLNEVVHDANMLLKEGQVILIPKNINYTIHSDEKIVELALFNLISNAVKYSPEYSSIVLEVINKNGFLQIAIKDHGIGIPEREQKFIFGRYYRAENALTTEGTGIGLNIVKSHVENLGGTVIFESKPGEGSTFSIKLPNTPKL